MVPADAREAMFRLGVVIVESALVGIGYGKAVDNIKSVVAYIIILNQTRTHNYSFVKQKHSSCFHAGRPIWQISCHVTSLSSLLKSFHVRLGEGNRASRHWQNCNKFIRVRCVSTVISISTLLRARQGHKNGTNSEERLHS